MPPIWLAADQLPPAPPIFALRGKPPLREDEQQGNDSKGGKGGSKASSKGGKGETIESGGGKGGIDLRRGSARASYRSLSLNEDGDLEQDTKRTQPVNRGSPT